MVWFAMFMFLYHFVWILLLVLCIPMVTLLRKNQFVDRLALRLPPISLREGNIWIHALSVGEVISALPLVKVLNMRYANKDIVFTVTTPRGMAVARNELEGKVKVLFTMPIDFLLMYPPNCQLCQALCFYPYRNRCMASAD